MLEFARFAVQLDDMQTGLGVLGAAERNRVV